MQREAFVLILMRLSRLLMDGETKNSCFRYILGFFVFMPNQKSIFCQLIINKQISCRLSAFYCV